VESVRLESGSSRVERRKEWGVYMQSDASTVLKNDGNCIFDMDVFA